MLVPSLHHSACFIIIFIFWQEIGAISCMIRRPDDGKLKGYNVDYLGAIAAIEEALGGLYLCYKVCSVYTFLVDVFSFNPEFSLQHPMVPLHLFHRWQVNSLLSWELVELERPLLMVHMRKEQELLLPTAHMVRSYNSCIIFFVLDQYVFCDFTCRKY
jgi:hypothetical protein